MVKIIIWSEFIKEGLKLQSINIRTKIVVKSILHNNFKLLFDGSLQFFHS